MVGTGHVEGLFECLATFYFLTGVAVTRILT